MPVIAIYVPDNADEQVALFTETFGTEPGCIYESQDWAYAEADPNCVPFLMCDSHSYAATVSALAFEPGEERGLCTLQHTRLCEELTDRAYAKVQADLEAEREPGATTETRA
jgi:hypothetical protein